MLDNRLHNTLKRQIEKFGAHLLEDPTCKDFINLVDETYKGFDEELKEVRNVLDVSSKELFIANKKIIAERDDTKAKLETVVDNINGVIFKTDLYGNFTFLNNAWTEWTGLTIRESLGRNFAEFMNSTINDKNEKILDLFSLKDQEVKFIFKQKIVDKTYWFEAKTKLFKNKEQKAKGYVGTIVDITNLKTTEIELQKAGKSKDEFLSTMSHEIRTPLNAVTGFSNILLMEDFLPEQEENLKALKYSSEHLLTLINDLLDFDKINSGKVKIVKQKFSLHIFLENIKSHFILRAKEKNISFRLICEQDVPDKLIGDELKLTQVIKNLISNSLKFTEKGEITLSVSKIESLKGGTARLQFEVIDTGIGIPLEKQTDIFESFVQASSDTTIKYGGSGLGLPISKKLLKLQGSNLKVRSQLGVGTTFSFIIDYKINLSGISDKIEVFKFKNHFMPLNVNVLVAEDNRMNVMILKRFFSNWKVRCSVAKNGKEAIELLFKEDFDLILMDLQMPILDGYETTRLIRNSKDKRKSKIPIVALTAFAQTDIKKRTEQYKMNGFMSKPFEPQKLYNLLKTYCKVQAMESTTN